MRWVVCTFLLGVVACSYASPADAAKNVIRRYFPTVADYFRFENLVGARPLACEYEAVDSRVTVRGGSGVAMCRGAYDYLRKACGAQVTWSGTSFHAPKRLPDAPRTRVESP